MLGATCRAVVFSPQCGQVRHSSGKLKELGMRLKAITNIQKITKTMKMISAAKFAKASRAVIPARAYGVGAISVYEKAGVEQAAEGSVLYIAISSDRGLCGSLHSNIGREVIASRNELPAGTESKIITVGEKVKAFLQVTNPNDLLCEFTELGRNPPSFQDAAAIANNILKTDFEYTRAVVVFNWFKTAMTQVITHQPVYTEETLGKAPSMSVYDSLDEDVIKSYQEFQLANTLYYTIKENYTSEQGARMVSMDGATKNAGDIIERMSLQYNRTRQAVITTELTEIISGMIAISE